jgi:hypothetical protein
VDEAPPSGSRLKTALLMAGGAIAVGLVVGGVVIFVTADNSQPAPAPSASGFDVTELPKTQAPEGLSAALPPQQPSSLSMVPKLGLGAQTAAAPAQAAPSAAAGPLEQAADGFRQAIRASEKTLGDLARDYTRRYPAIARYGRDWMSYPDLKKLNDDYMRDHDPIAFLRGLSASPSFPKLLSKYAGEPAIRGFVQDAVTKAPAGAVGASMNYLNQDQTLDGFVQGVAGKVGLPAGLLQASNAAVSGPNPPDVRKLAEDAMKGMPLPPGADDKAGRR